MLNHQRVTPGSLGNFPDFDNEHNRKILEIIEEYSPASITRRFAKKKEKPALFVKKFASPENIEKILRPFLDQRLHQILDLLSGHFLYQRVRNNPVEERYKIEKNPANIRFHFRKTEDETWYYPVIHQDNVVVSLFNARHHVLVNEPAWICDGSYIYHFAEAIEARKLVPFFTKQKVRISKEAEAPYYKKFVNQMIRQFEVRSFGFQIEESISKPAAKAVVLNEEPARLIVRLTYAGDEIGLEDSTPFFVEMYRQDDRFHFRKYRRNKDYERELIDGLSKIGLKHTRKSEFSFPEECHPVTFINEQFDFLKDMGLEFVLEGFEKNYQLGQNQFEIRASESENDFKLNTRFGVGGEQISITKIQKAIAANSQEVTLDNGKIGLIPKDWLEKYRYHLLFSEKSDDGSRILRKQHENLIRESRETKKDENAKKLEVSLYEQLRDYQREGLAWLWSLRKRELGAILADDMGLGKTLQTIALLQAHYLSENGEEVQEDLFSFSRQDTQPTLIVMPASLIFNWQRELRRFAPELRVYAHAGQNRNFDELSFKRHQLVLTTYGLIRNDLNYLKKFDFAYVVLDESQNIKNPQSKTAKAVRELNARYRLALSGTPIENTLTDLWSQMNFLNKGLLGSYAFFKREFSVPIEKRGNEVRKEQLKKIVHPYILRRTKEEVAKELPPLTEQTLFIDMEKEQRLLYNSVKDYYKQNVIDKLDEKGFRKNRFMILRGLMHLRLIANHPKLYDENSSMSSGKFREIREHLDKVLSAGHNVLVFSQFVKHLKLLEHSLIEGGIRYEKLTGSSRNRQQIIDSFTEDKDCSVFLISLKAGGVGLNLTKADYIFLLDPWWNPFTERQAIDRAYRIGQEQHVFSYRFVTNDSLEERILQLQERKQELAKDIIPAGQQTKSLSREEIASLFE